MKAILATVFMLGFLAACEEVEPMEVGMMGEEGAAMEAGMVMPDGTVM